MRKEPLKDRFWRKVRKTRTCWIWTGAGIRYGHIKYEGKTLSAHHASWLIHFGNRPKYLRHKCDNGLCVRPNHLEIGTSQDNVDDRERRGRSAKGENHGRAKLSDRQVLAIRKLHDLGWSSSSIGKIFKIDRTYVWNIYRKVFRK